MENPSVAQFTTFLKQYVGKTLRIRVDDKRIFVGQLRCTDADCNLVLSCTHEFRPPEESVIRAEAQRTGNSSLHMGFTRRFVGLVVVPGKCIKQIEQEQYISPGQQHQPQVL